MRLRTVSPNDRGWTRRRAGSGFVYLDADGRRLSGEEVERIKSLVIPPAWTDVWICPRANGHIQAVGTDAAGRRQYLYHPVWREKRDQAKFDRVIAMAKRLPRVRRQVVADLDAPDLTKTAVLAATVRLIDLGLFRIGSEEYVDDNGGYGLTTLERRHVKKQGDGLIFSFLGKSGVPHEIVVDDPEVCALVGRIRRRRGGGEERLLAYKNGSRWCPVQAAEVNDYLRETFGMDVTAKDFRTWHATVIAATALGEAATGERIISARAKRTAVKGAIEEVASYLGNTPAIARSSYVDPRVVDLFDDGITIAAALRRLPRSPRRRRAQIEKAVLRLLSRSPDAAARAARSARRSA